jgi:hypothetical protein
MILLDREDRKELERCDKLMQHRISPAMERPYLSTKRTIIAVNADERWKPMIYAAKPLLRPS